MKNSIYVLVGHDALGSTILGAYSHWQDAVTAHSNIAMGLMGADRWVNTEVIEVGLDMAPALWGE